VRKGRSRCELVAGRTYFLQATSVSKIELTGTKDGWSLALLTDNSKRASSAAGSLFTHFPAFSVSSRVAFDPLETFRSQNIFIASITPAAYAEFSSGLEFDQDLQPIILGDSAIAT